MPTITRARLEALEMVASAARRRRRAWENDCKMMMPGKDPWDPALAAPESVDLVRALDRLDTIIAQEKRAAIERRRRPAESVS